MFLERLELQDFRNYATLTLELSQPLTLFTGRNAQGKTNLLEAVLLLALARSPRTRRDAELVRWGSREAIVRGEVRRTHRDRVAVNIALRTDGGKTIKVDGSPIRRLIDAVGHVNVVFFGPEELRLVSGGPGERRAYLSASLGQTSAAYLTALASYRTVLRQRNTLLRRQREARLDPELLLAYDDRLAAEAGVLMAERLAQTRRLEAEAQAVHQRLSGGRETLTVRYRPDVPLPAAETAADFAAAMAERLLARRDEELRRGVTVVGPHRDDLQVRLNDREARTYGSQGQQRTAALALKIAELRVLTAAIGEPPLLLLDDVMSELDDQRRGEVMALIDEADQVLITCAQTSSFSPGLLSRAALYRVDAGAVSVAPTEASG